MNYVIVSDIHANYEALQAVDQAVARWQLRQPNLQYWFLGDILGYGPDPIECLRWFRYSSQIGERWVAGNHDVEVLRLGMRSASGRQTTQKGISNQAQESWRRHLEQLERPENSGWWEWFSSEVKQASDKEQRSMVVEEHGDLACVFVHASVNAAVRRTQYLYPWAHHLNILQVDLQRLWNEYGERHRTICLFHGHTHYPLFAVLKPDGSGIDFRLIPYEQPIPLGEGCLAINPGSVGQPRDGDPRAAFAILDTEQRTITFHRTMYDVQSTVSKLQRGGYPNSLIKLLTTADGGANLAYYRTIYRAPELHHLPTISEKS